MKSYLFTTDDGRGGVILCDIDTMEEVVPYLQQRFKGVIRVEQGHKEWTLSGGFSKFTPRPISEINLDGGANQDCQPSEPVQLESEATDDSAASPTGSLF